MAHGSVFSQLDWDHACRGRCFRALAENFDGVNLSTGLVTPACKGHFELRSANQVLNDSH
jgi:hypothetical protein